jgi:hypothetical protein
VGRGVHAFSCHLGVEKSGEGGMADISGIGLIPLHQHITPCSIHFIDLMTMQRYCCIDLLLTRKRVGRTSMASQWVHAS